MTSTMSLLLNSRSQITLRSMRHFEENVSIESIEESHLVSFQRGDSLPLRPNLLWKLDKGFVRTLTWDDLGNVITLGIWGAGDWVGQALSQIQPYQIECLTPVQAEQLTPTCLTQNIISTETIPLTSVMQHVYQTEQLLSIIHCKRMSTRLLYLLDWLANRFGKRIDEGQLLELRLTHQVIAEIIGTTRVTVTRLLRQLECEGHIIRRRRALILPSRI